MEHWAETTPDKEYLVYSDRDLRFTWSEFNEACGPTWRKACLSIGINHGTHVGVLGDQCTRLAYIPVCRREDRSRMVTINTNYKQSELEFLVENADIHTIMHYRRRVRRKLCRHGIHHAARTEGITTRLPEKQTFPGSEKCSLHRTGEIQRNVQHSRTAASRTKRQDETLLEAKSEVNPHDVVNMQYTSGTTGFPERGHADAL